MNRRALAFLLFYVYSLISLLNSNQIRRNSQVLLKLSRRCSMFMRVGGFNFVIQQQTASEEKHTRHQVFYMLIRTHETQ